MHRSAIILLLLLGIPVFAGLKTVTIETERFRAEILEPSDAADLRKTGNRFLRGCWIRSLTVKQTNQEILRKASLHTQLPLFGCPFEIYPGPVVKNGQAPGWDTRMQIGVGIVREKGEGRYETIPVQWFRWRSELRQNAEETILTAHQKPAGYAGYRYELTVSTVFRKRTDAISVSFEIVNTGKKTIETELYAHPFFNAPSGFGNGWYQLKDQAQIPLKAERERNHDVSGKIRIGGWPGCRYEIELSGKPEPARVFFWRNKKTAFSLEPYWKINIRPGEKQTIVFDLTIHPVSASDSSLHN